MGKGEKKKNKGALNIPSARTIRESGKATINPSRLALGCTRQKMKHLQRLAVWANGENSIPPLGALLGTRLAAVSDVSGKCPPDSPFFTCESDSRIILIPDSNKMRTDSMQTSWTPVNSAANEVVLIGLLCT